MNLRIKLLLCCNDFILINIFQVEELKDVKESEEKVLEDKDDPKVVVMIGNDKVAGEKKDEQDVVK